jgi:hypothetical protein
VNNSVRNEAQKVGIGAIAVAVVVLVLFFFLSKSGLGNSSAVPETTSGASTMQSSAAAPSPAAT